MFVLVLVLLRGNRATRERQDEASSVISERSGNQMSPRAQRCSTHVCVHGIAFCDTEFCSLVPAVEKSVGQQEKLCKRLFSRTGKYKNGWGGMQSSQNNMNIKNCIDRISCTIHY